MEELITVLYSWYTEIDQGKKEQIQESLSQIGR